MSAVTICSDFGAQENKVCFCFQFFSPIYLPWSTLTGRFFLPLVPPKKSICITSVWYPGKLNVFMIYELNAYTFLRSQFLSFNILGVNAWGFAYITLLQVVWETPQGSQGRQTIEWMCHKTEDYWVTGASLVAQKVKASACNAGDRGSIPGWGRSPGEGNDNSLLYLYSCLGNPTDRGAWWATVNGVAKESDAT